MLWRIYEIPQKGAFYFMKLKCIWFSSFSAAFVLITINEVTLLLIRNHEFWKHLHQTRVSSWIHSRQSKRKEKKKLKTREKGVDVSSKSPLVNVGKTSYKYYQGRRSRGGHFVNLYKWACVNVLEGVSRVCKLVKLLLMQEMRGLSVLSDVSRHNYTRRCDALARPQELHLIASTLLMSPMSLLAVVITQSLLCRVQALRSAMNMILFKRFSNFIFHAVKIFKNLHCNMLPLFIGEIWCKLFET